MNRRLGTIGVALAVLLTASGTLSLFAQAKKTGKGTIELIESKDGKYRFSVRDADGKYLGGSSVGHDTEKEAKAAVEELKTVLSTASYVKRKADDTDEPAKEVKKNEVKKEVKKDKSK